MALLVFFAPACNDNRAHPIGDAGAVRDATADLARAPDPCHSDGGCAIGTWVNVTPPAIDLVNGACGNYGAKTVQGDPHRPSDLYVQFNCQGIWKSTDYGQTWNGPINTGANGAAQTDCAGALATASNGAGPPILYNCCIRGAGVGPWKSINGGVDWAPISVTPAGSFNQFYHPAIDPYDPNHLLMNAHGMNLLLQSLDGAQSWSAVSTDPAMQDNIPVVVFIDTGVAATTRNSWLWIASAHGGSVGTWRTENGGTQWTHVDSNEHSDGTTELYQPDTSGILYVPGQYAGVMRSADYGRTFTRVGQMTPETIVFGTAKHIYAGYGWAIGANMSFNPNLEITDSAGTGEWTAVAAPTGMSQGPAHAVVVNDGAHSVFITANYNGGIWRYVEP
jgi:hypothetical protein